MATRWSTKLLDINLTFVCAVGETGGDEKSVLAHKGRLFSEKENALCGLLS